MQIAATSGLQTGHAGRVQLWSPETSALGATVGLSLSEYRRAQALTRLLTSFTSFRDLLVAQRLWSLTGYRPTLRCSPLPYHVSASQSPLVRKLEALIADNVALADLYDRAQAARQDSRRAIRR